MSPYIVTHSGQSFNLVEPDLGDIRIHDIAHSLAKQCRFTGHTVDIDKHYSIAQHSVLVARLCSDENKLCGLMHDATEAYLGDVSSPLKSLLPDYKGLERNMWRWIAKRFDLPRTMPDEVRQADVILLATERRDLMPATNDRWPILDGVVPMKETIVPWSPRMARDAFLSAFGSFTTARRHSIAEAMNVQ